MGLLLESGVDVNARRGAALRLAAANGNEAIVGLLLENGATVSITTRNGPRAITDLLLESGAGVNVRVELR